MKTKIQIKSIFGSVLFEFEKENNTIKDTLIKALKGDAYLRGADLGGADLRDADLRGADLGGAYLGGAYLQDAYLRDADLRGADLRDAYLRGAYLRDADLRDADLRGADLGGADLRDADLGGAYLRGAYLRGAYLQDADYQKIKYQFQIIPEEGSLIAWKKAANNCIVKLEVPASAKRLCNTLNRKCRASYVKTLNIYDSNNKEIKEVSGQRDKSIIYKVGRITRADKFDDNPFEDCSHGIHFFVTKQEAIDW